MVEVVSISNMSFGYRKPKKDVFLNFDLAFEAGRITSVLGHNGAGKTTLLKLVYGTLKPKAGKIQINQSCVNSYNDIFIQSDKFGINLDLSLRENLVFRSMIFNRDAARVLENELLDKFKLRSQIDMPTRKLSTGNLTRANIVAGLIFNPSLILLDEPTNSIDPATRELLMSELPNLSALNTSVIMVTHDLDFAYKLSDRIIVIDDGGIVIDDAAPRRKAIDSFRKEYISYTEWVE